MKRLMLVILLFCAVFSLSAQDNKSEKEQKFVYPQKVSPVEMDNYLFSMYYYNGKKTYNLRNAVLSNTGTVTDMKINPSGASFAVVHVKGKKAQLTIYDLWKSNKVKQKVEGDFTPVALCYAPDARRLAVSTTDKELLFLDTQAYETKQKIALPFVAKEMAISGNGYFVAATDGATLNVWNLETGKLRKTIETSDSIRSFAFAPDDSQLAVLTADGVLATYDTRTFFLLQTYDAMGEARYCAYHPEGKYMAVVTGDNRISIINLMDETDREYIDNNEGGITEARFLKDGKGGIHLVYNTLGAVTYELMSRLAPNYTKLMADELDQRMNDWLKMMPGETLEEYNQRVNDETRAQQMRLFEQEIATRMADGLVERSEVTLGEYNLAEGMLAIGFNTMPTIYLDVPKEEVQDFMDPGNLEFRNAVYGLTKQDKFELVYADVYNRASGKTYTYDNRERRSFDYLQSGDDFVPLELVQQANMDEIKLQEIKENVVNLAKQQNILSDHTRISVDADINRDTDADGKGITNYTIGFTYEVEEGFSAQEDFGSGKYATEQSPAAMAMLSIVKTAFEKEFAAYVKPGKKLKVKITGMADGNPVKGRIAYDGRYGEYTDEPVYKDENLTHLSVTRKDGITDNDQLAFLRAAGVKHHIEQNIPAFTQMDAEYSYYIEVAKEKGSEYRRINVVFTFVDAF